MHTDLLAVRLGGGFRPVIMSWLITDHCNLQCGGCARRHGRKGHVSEPVIRSVLAQVARRRIPRVSLTGGEPLVHPGIAGIVEGLKNAGARVTINTNGILAADRIQVLKSAAEVCTGLDGGRRTHEALRGPGTYEQILAALEILAAERIPRKMQSTITGNTEIGDLESVLEVAERFATPVVFQPARRVLLGGEEPNLLSPDDRRFQAVVDFLKKAKRRHGTLILNSRAGLKHLSNWPHAHTLACGAGRFFFRINQLGDIYPCSDLPGICKPVGNVLKDDIIEAVGKAGPVSCGECWCALRVETNLCYNMNPDALIHYMRVSRDRKKRR